MSNLKVYLGLVHHPIKNKRGDVVTTSVTNLDIHDIARTCRTFGLQKYFIITPLKAQHELVNRILGHWEEDKANAYNPDRQDALSIAKLKNSIEEAILEIEDIEGQRPYLISTGANFKDNDGNIEVLREKLNGLSRPAFILFGTGWGLVDTICEESDFKLGPIFGASQDGYNHLSVRSAAAIYCSKLMESTI